MHPKSMSRQKKEVSHQTEERSRHENHRNMIGIGDPLCSTHKSNELGPQAWVEVHQVFMLMKNAWGTR